jgi:hypothetical protein
VTLTQSIAKTLAKIGEAAVSALDVCYGSFSDFGARSCEVRFASMNGHRQAASAGLKSAISGLMHRSKQHLYSITSSARASSVGGTSIPSALAVFILMINSKWVGCSTGRSAGWAPFRILST